MVYLVQNGHTELEELTKQEQEEVSRMQSDVIVVTASDIYYVKTSVILCIGCDAYAESIIDNPRRMDTPATVYVTTTQTTLEWLAQA